MAARSVSVPTTESKSLIRANTPDVAPELFEEAMMFTANFAFSGLASNVDDARALWRKYKWLVEDSEYPQFLRAPLRSEYNCDPGHINVDPWVDGITAKDVRECHRQGRITDTVRRKLTPEAMRVAREWKAQRDNSPAGARLALTPQPTGIKPEARPEVLKAAEPKSGSGTDAEDARVRFAEEMSEAVRFLTDKELADLLMLVGTTIRCTTAVARRDGREPRSEPSVQLSTLAFAPPVIADKQAIKNRSRFLASIAAALT